MSLRINPSRNATKATERKKYGYVIRVPKLPEPIATFQDLVVYLETDRCFYQCVKVTDSKLQKEYYRWVSVTYGAARVYIIPVDKLSTDDVRNITTRNEFNAIVYTMNELVFGFRRYKVNFDPIGYVLTSDTTQDTSKTYYQWSRNEKDFIPANWVSTTDSTYSTSKTYYRWDRTTRSAKQLSVAATATTLPTASADNLGTRLFYTGTSGTYLQNRMYTCTTEDEGVTYFWAVSSDKEAAGQTIDDPYGHIYEVDSDYTWAAANTYEFTNYSFGTDRVAVEDLANSMIDLLNEHEAGIDSIVASDSHYTVCKIINDIIDEVNPFSVEWQWLVDKINQIQEEVDDFVAYVDLVIEGFEGKLNDFDRKIGDPAWFNDSTDASIKKYYGDITKSPKYNDGKPWAIVEIINDFGGRITTMETTITNTFADIEEDLKIMRKQLGDVCFVKPATEDATHTTYREACLYYKYTKSTYSSSNHNGEWKITRVDTTNLIGQTIPSDVYVMTGETVRTLLDALSARVTTNTNNITLHNTNVDNLVGTARKTIYMEELGSTVVTGRTYYKVENDFVNDTHKFTEITATEAQAALTARDSDPQTKNAIGVIFFDATSNNRGNTVVDQIKVNNEMIAGVLKDVYDKYWDLVDKINAVGSAYDSKINRLKVLCGIAGDYSAAVSAWNVEGYELVSTAFPDETTYFLTSTSSREASKYYRLVDGKYQEITGIKHGDTIVNIGTVYVRKTDEHENNTIKGLVDRNTRMIKSNYAEDQIFHSWTKTAIDNMQLTMVGIMLSSLHELLQEQTTVSLLHERCNMFINLHNALELLQYVPDMQFTSVANGSAYDSSKTYFVYDSVLSKYVIVSNSETWSTTGIVPNDGKIYVTGVAMNPEPVNLAGAKAENYTLADIREAVNEAFTMHIGASIMNDYVQMPDDAYIESTVDYYRIVAGEYVAVTYSTMMEGTRIYEWTSGTTDHWYVKCEAIPAYGYSINSVRIILNELINMHVGANTPLAATESLVAGLDKYRLYNVAQA